MKLSFKVEPRLTLEEAEKACKSFGTRWKITRKAHGAAVCSTVSWEKNCNKCDSWRLLVWNDGACEKIKNDATKCQSNITKGGHFYCGHDPCTPYGDLSYGGTWG